MGAVIEEAPYWLEAAHPESRFVDALGAPQRLQTASINTEWWMAKPMHGLGSCPRGGRDISSGIGEGRFKTPIDVRI